MKESLNKEEQPPLILINGTVALIRPALFAYSGHRPGCLWELDMWFKCCRVIDTYQLALDITGQGIAPNSAEAKLHPDGKGRLFYIRSDGRQAAVDAFFMTKTLEQPAPPPAPDRDDEEPQHGYGYAGPGMGR
jgi:hypothetical protein